eukprot:CAMPEP_0113505652 /NCGR_PEP_ID=MMETSP0014_2-20120614/35444_1 /TAXON_ID=2857 /ORGANISM="Nitzschia sp." /LENGTH=570 /DNA_ID=CAMNT_0000401005 /DNA_START=154 /DNA_END=1866 /DNA_ORIENTATION=- /assembly_acc=CAM_ASM_000159
MYQRRTISTSNDDGGGGSSNSFLRPRSRQRQRQHHEQQTNKNNGQVHTINDKDPLTVTVPPPSPGHSLARRLVSPMTPQRSSKSKQHNNNKSTDHAHASSSTTKSTSKNNSNSNNNQRQMNTSKRPQPVRWFANARKDNSKQTSTASVVSTTAKAVEDTDSEEIEHDAPTTATKKNSKKTGGTKSGTNNDFEDDDEDDDDGMVSDDESLASTIRERAEKNASTPNDGKTKDPPACGEEIWLNAGIALTTTNSSSGDDEDDRLLLFDDDQDDGSRSRFNDRRKGDGGKKDAPGSPSRRELVTRSAVSDLMLGAEVPEVDISIDQGNDVSIDQAEKEDTGSAKGALAVSLFGRFMNAANSIDSRRQKQSDDAESDDSVDVQNEDLYDLNDGEDGGEETATIEDDHEIESVEGIVSKTLPSEILTLSSRSPSKSSPSSRNNKRSSPQSTATALENAQELANRLARDLESLRGDNEKLVQTNRRLLTSLQGVKQYQEDNMILRSRLIKAALYCAPVFYFCGGLDSFLSTVLLVWVLVELESYLDAGDDDAVAAAAAAMMAEGGVGRFADEESTL